MGYSKQAWLHYWRLSVVSLGIALLAAFILLAGRLWYNERDELLAELQVQMQIVGDNASAALVFHDQENAQEILASLERSASVLEAALYRSDGTLLADFRRHGANQQRAPILLSAGLPAMTANLSELRLLQPIRQGNRHVGTILLWASWDRIYDELQGFLGGFLVTAIVAGVVAFLAGHGIRLHLAENQHALEDSRATIRLLSAHREQLVDAEHRRIAQEIHDELGQILNTALLHLRRLERLKRNGSALAPEQLQEVEGLVEDAISSARSIATDLRPPVLNIGFAAAVEWLLERMLAGSGIAYTVDMPEPMPTLDERQATTLFRIVQESLTNILRHAAAHKVHISLSLGNRRLYLLVEDDGIGFVPPRKTAAYARFGLVGMGERASSLGGVAEIDSRPGAGTRIKVELPYLNSSPEHEHSH